MQQRFVYVYLRNALSTEQIQDIDNWLHQYCHDVHGNNGRWQFRMRADEAQARDSIELALGDARHGEMTAEQLSDCLGYIPEQKLGLLTHDHDNQQQMVSTLAQCLATKFEGIVHYEHSQA